MVGLSAAQQPSAFDGTWVLRVNGDNIFKLSLTNHGGRVAGWLIKPTQLSIDQDGTITATGPDQVTLPVQKATPGPGRLDLTIDDDLFVMTLVTHNRATLAMEGMRPWTLERSSDGSPVILASRLSERPYSDDIRALRQQLRVMVEEEQEARLALDAARMEAADAKNRPEVLRIYGQYGWVTQSLAGNEAAHNFWLLVQHQTPEIQRRLLPALEKAAKANDASMSDYAYLYDRVQLGLGKPQYWGSQIECQHGKPVLARVDDPAGLNDRRKKLFMLPIREYLKNDYLAKMCAQGGKQP